MLSKGNRNYSFHKVQRLRSNVDANTQQTGFSGEGECLHVELLNHPAVSICPWKTTRWLSLRNRITSFFLPSLWVYFCCGCFFCVVWQLFFLSLSGLRSYDQINSNSVVPKPKSRNKGTCRDSRQPAEAAPEPSSLDCWSVLFPGLLHEGRRLRSLGSDPAPPLTV